MTESARLKTSVGTEESAQFTALAAAQGMSVSHLLKRLVRKAIAEKPQVHIAQLNAAARNNRAPAEKYTVRLMSSDAAQLEERALVRRLTPSGYVAHLLRAHLRANPPMPYREFQELKRVVNELADIRGTLQQLMSGSSAAELLDAGVRENILKLLTPLKLMRQQIKDTLEVNAKSWEAPDA